ncbi:DUF6461 domain-containing protein [Streptomyces sp. NPDC057011]|uniref:DUF6461 domain-containing protein n=1 Tax=unclassified Streptomyces TaxID=2593676 RepID=UPI00363CBDFF
MWVDPDDDPREAEVETVGERSTLLDCLRYFRLTIEMKCAGLDAGPAEPPGRGGRWTLALEFGGELGMRAGFMEAISAGTRAVSHSGNGGKPMDFFHWYEDGVLRTTFEWAADRTGSTPDDLNAELRELGLNPDGDPDPGTDTKAAVLALTERLTGVRVTADLLANSEYATAEVPQEPAEEWESITIDITDTHGEHTYAHVRRDQL